jgi:hypothetical protein
MPHQPAKNPGVRFLHETEDQLKFLERPDAPLAKHPDAHAAYGVLCTNIRWIEYLDSGFESSKDGTRLCTSY